MTIPVLADRFILQPHPNSDPDLAPAPDADPAL